MTEDNATLAAAVKDFIDIAKDALGDLCNELGLDLYQVLSLALLLYERLLDREDAGQTVYVARQVKPFPTTLAAYLDDTQPFGDNPKFRALVESQASVPPERE